LQLRSRLGTYVPLQVSGQRSANAIAYARGDVVTVVPRLTLRDFNWEDTFLELAAGRDWRNVLTGENIGGGTVLLTDLFRRFPVALLAAS